MYDEIGSYKLKILFITDWSWQDASIWSCTTHREQYDKDLWWRELRILLYLIFSRHDISLEFFINFPTIFFINFPIVVLIVSRADDSLWSLLSLSVRINMFLFLVMIISFSFRVNYDSDFSVSRCNIYWRFLCDSLVKSMCRILIGEVVRILLDDSRDL